MSKRYEVHAVHDGKIEPYSSDRFVSSHDTREAANAAALDYNRNMIGICGTTGTVIYLVEDKVVEQLTEEITSTEQPVGRKLEEEQPTANA